VVWRRGSDEGHKEMHSEFGRKTLVVKRTLGRPRRRSRVSSMLGFGISGIERSNSTAIQSLYLVS
jgi:hypothetical protein